MIPIKRPHLIIHALVFILSVFIAKAQEFTAGINTETPNPNAVLHLVSPNGDQGLLIPALTNAQRGAMGLAATDKGLLVFDSDDDAFYFWDGSGWVGLNVPASIADGIDFSELTGVPANLDIDNTDDVTLAAFPNLDTDFTDDITLGTAPAAGDISGDYSNGFQINPNIVSSLEITDGTISNVDIGADAVQNGNILDGTIGDADLDKTNIPLSGFGAATATVDAGNQLLSNVLDPVGAQDAATKNYVDAIPTLPVTTDGQIIVSNGTTPTAVTMSGDVTIDNAGATTIGANAVTDGNLDKVNIPLSGFGAATATVDAGNQLLSNVLDPVGAQDAATKNYVDAIPTLPVTTDGQIIVSNGTTPTAVTMSGDVTIDNAGATTIGANAVTDGNLDKVNIPLSGFGAATATVDAGNQLLSNVLDPVGAQDAATKNYVDAIPTLPATTDGQIIVSNGTTPTAVTMSGDVTIDNAGATTIGANAVADGNLDKVNIPLSGFGAATATVDAGNQLLSNVLDPVGAQDAATKNYVDAIPTLPATTDGQIIVSNGTTPTAVTMSGDITIDNAGATTIGANAVGDGNLDKVNIPLSGFGAATATVDAGNQLLSNVLDPVGAQDAATRNYVDTQGFITGEVQTLGAVIALGNDAGGSTITNVLDPIGAQDVATRNYVDTQGFITGEVQTLGAVIALGNDAGASTITNVLDPVGPQDVATRNYVDTQGFITGEVQTLGAVIALGNDAGGSTITNVLDPVGAQDVATRNYVDTQGFITGEVQTLGAVIALGNDAGGSTITNVLDPVGAQDVATRNYVDTQGFITGEVQTLGAVIALGNDAGGSTITNVLDPVGAQDVATRNYVDTQGFITGEVQTLGAVIALGNDAGGSTITNVLDPVGAQDVATRNYVDTQGFITAESQDLTLTGNTLAISGDPNTDVDLSFNPPTDGDVLTWDNANTRWDAAAPAPLLNSGNGITVNVGNIDLGGALTDATGTNITTGAGGLDLTIDGAGNFTASAAIATNLNSPVTNLGDANTDQINVIGTMNINEDITFNEATNPLTLQVTDQATAAGTLIIPDLGGNTEIIATLSDISGSDYLVDGNGNNLGSNSAGAPTGANNIILGLNAGGSVASGSDNIVIGSNADNTGATTGGNVAIGNTADANGGDAIAIGTGSSAAGVNSVALGTNAVATNPNTIVLGGTGANAVSVGIGTTTPRAPLQVGGEFSMGYFQNATETIDGDAILSNLYPDYTNATDNQLRRSNTDSASFIFFADGEILFMNVVNGATDSQLNLSGGDIRSWMEMRNDGNISISEAIRLGSPDPGDEEDGMIRFNGSSFEGYSSGAWNALDGGGGFTLPYNPGPVSFASNLFELTQQDGGSSAGRFSIDNTASVAAALIVETNSTNIASRALEVRHSGSNGDAGSFNVIGGGAGTALFASSDGSGSALTARKESGSTGTSANIVHDGTSGNGLFISIGNVGNASPALDITNAGTGPDIRAGSSNFTVSSVGEVQTPGMDINNTSTTDALTITNSIDGRSINASTNTGFETARFEHFGSNVEIPVVRIEQNGGISAPSVLANTGIIIGPLENDLGAADDVNGGGGLRFTGTTFEGNIDGTPTGWVDLLGGGFTLPVSDGGFNIFDDVGDGTGNKTITHNIGSDLRYEEANSATAIIMEDGGRLNFFSFPNQPATTLISPALADTRMALVNTGLAINGDAPDTDVSLDVRSIGVNTAPDVLVFDDGADAASDASIGFRSNNGANANFVMGIDADNNQNFLISESSALGSNDRFVIERVTGDVGIGTLSPQGRLDVDLGAATNTVFFRAANNQTQGFIDVVQTGTGSAATRYQVPGFQSTMGLDNGGDFHIEMGSGLNGTEEFTISSTGEVGIGTTTPRGSLDVVGSQYVTVTTIDGATDYNVAGNDYMIFVSGAGGANVNLPAAPATDIGRKIKITTSATTPISVNTTGSIITDIGQIPNLSMDYTSGQVYSVEFVQVAVDTWATQSIVRLQ